MSNFAIEKIYLYTLKARNHILLCVGCNTNPERQMREVKELLKNEFIGMRFTEVLTSAAYGMAETAAPYTNLMADGVTNMTRDELVKRLKDIEEEAGNKKELREKGVVMMDIDLMSFNNQRYHDKDWGRPYVRTLLDMLKKMTVVLLLVSSCLTVAAQSAKKEQEDGKELLGKAVEYYIGGKYHETILAFEKLKRNYKLTPRLKAYLGFSYYKEGEYKEAVECLRDAVPELAAFSPKEQSAYIYACAESLFSLQKYEEAIKYYDMLLPMTEGNDRGDVLFHKAFSLYIYKEMEEAERDSMKIARIAPEVEDTYGMFSDAMDLYRENVRTATELQVARRRQCERMIKGFEANLLLYIQKKDTLSHE